MITVPITCTQAKYITFIVFVILTIATYFPLSEDPEQSALTIFYAIIFVISLFAVGVMALMSTIIFVFDNVRCKCE